MTDTSYRLVKRSVSLDGHHTSVALERPFWDEIALLAQARSMSVSALISAVDRERAPDQGLASALRLEVLTALQERSAD